MTEQMAEPEARGIIWIWMPPGDELMAGSLRRALWDAPPTPAETKALSAALAALAHGMPTVALIELQKVAAGCSA